MLSNKHFWLTGVVLTGSVLFATSWLTEKSPDNNSQNLKSEIMENNQKDSIFPIFKPEELWKKELSDMEYHVIRTKGTERPFTGEYWDHFEAGKYVCRACGLELFDSETKFDAHCGWPSFFDAIDSKNIATEGDYLLGYRRTELMCANCGGHLGHVFEDGPAPTGLRYCINSVSIKFEEQADGEQKK